MTSTLEIQSNSPEETIEIGRLVATILQSGDVVGLVGPLGAGKTLLTKGIALGLGVEDSRMVNSPTFVLVNEYSGRIPLHHIDAYRLGSLSEFEALGTDEMIREGVVIVEWADRAREVIGATALWIELLATGETKRTLMLSTEHPALVKRLSDLGTD